MRLSTSSIVQPRGLAAIRGLSPRWVWTAIVVILAGVFWMDFQIEAAPVQHLYYLAVILAAYRFGRWPGLGVAAVSVLLYHVANKRAASLRYEEIDIIQVTLFFAVALVTSKLTSDAERLRRLAATDDLTGLHNLRSFESHLTGMIEQAWTLKGAVCVMVLDLDRLKAINDQFGHLTGAEAVRTVGTLIRTHLPPDGIACRFGGDEFAIALPACQWPRAEQIALGLVDEVYATAPVLDGRPFAAHTISISIGLVVQTWERETAAPASWRSEGEALFRAADQALYRAKAAGRNRICLSAPGLLAEL